MYCSRSSILFVAITLAACHSSSGGSKNGGAGGASGQGGSTSGGPGGSATGGQGAHASGSAASGGTAGTGAGGHGGTVTGGAGGVGGGTSLDPTEVCRASVRAQAERAALCLGLDTVESYMRIADACPDYAFNPDSERTVEGLAACLPALSARTCTDVTVGFMPACFLAGKRAPGATCTFSSQCKQAFCETRSEGCGVCHDGGMAAGTCSGTFNCLVGSFCNFGKGICVDNITMVYATEGQPCDLYGAPTVGCTGDLYCRRGDSTGTAGTCSSAPGAGQPCGSDGIHDSVCSAGTTCTAGTCQPPGDCGSGLQCDSASYCVSTGDSFACAPRASVGQTCSSATPGSGTSSCLSPAICGSGGTCFVPGAAGQHCDTANPCDKMLICVVGNCQPNTLASCPG